MSWTNEVTLGSPIMLTIFTCISLFASIHRNTDNIHIHFSTIKQKPSRELQEWNGEILPRGKRRQSTMDTMKTSFGNELLENKDDLNFRTLGNSSHLFYFGKIFLVVFVIK